MDDPSRSDAKAALEEIDAARRAVVREGRRGLPVMLAAWSALVLVDHAAKDHVRDRSAQRVLSALCASATLAIALPDHRAKAVQPLSVDAGPPAAAPALAVVAGWAVAERALVEGVRRSGVRRPHTVVGVALAVLRPVAYLATLRVLPTPRPR